MPLTVWLAFSILMGSMIDRAVYCSYVTFSSTRTANITMEESGSRPWVVVPPDSFSPIYWIPSRNGPSVIPSGLLKIQSCIFAIVSADSLISSSAILSLSTEHPQATRVLLSAGNTDVSRYRYLFDFHLTASNIKEDDCNINVDSGPCDHNVQGTSVLTQCKAGVKRLCQSTRPVRVAFISDWGFLGDGLTATAAGASKRGYDRYIFGGDNVYESGIISPTDARMNDLYLNNFNKVAVPQYVVEGNHDALGNYLAQLLYSQYQDKWRAEYYYFNHTVSSRDVSVCLLLIDTEKLGMSGQEAFIHSILGSSHCQKSDFIVLAGHHPVFSSGGHGDSPSLKARFFPLLSHYKVDLYISGHDHTMSVHADSGVNFVVAGSSGKRTTSSLFLSSSKADRTFFSTYNTYGFADLQFNSGFLELQLIDSMTDQPVYTHKFASRKMDRIRANVQGDIWPLPTQGTTPFFSFSTAFIMISVILVWIAGVLSIRVHLVIHGAKLLGKIIFT